MRLDLLNSPVTEGELRHRLHRLNGSVRELILKGWDRKQP